MVIFLIRTMHSDALGSTYRAKDKNSLSDTSNLDVLFSHWLREETFVLTWHFYVLIRVVKVIVVQVVKPLRECGQFLIPRAKLSHCLI